MVTRNLAQAGGFAGCAIAGFPEIGVNAERLPEPLLRELNRVADTIIAEEAAKDDFAKILASQQQFRGNYKYWKSSPICPGISMNNTTLPHIRASIVIDGVIARIGKGLSYIWILLLGIIIVVNVVARYGSDQGRIELEELQWHLYSVDFLFGMSYAYQADTHIRVDVLHERMRPRTCKAWIELYGILLFLLPFIALILIYSAPFVLSVL